MQTSDKRVSLVISIKVERSGSFGGEKKCEYKEDRGNFLKVINLKAVNNTPDGSCLVTCFYEYVALISFSSCFRLQVLQVARPEKKKIKLT